MGGLTAPLKQVADALVAVESLAESLDSIGDSPSLRCADALEVIGAALLAHAVRTILRRFQFRGVV